MDIYKDIQKELVRQGYHVDFIPEGKYAEDPDNIRGYKGIKKLLYVRPKKFAKWNSEKWLSLLNSESYNKNYDILFVIDGQSIPKCLFEELRRRNNKLISVNYLFDTCSGVYRFDKILKNLHEYILLTGQSLINLDWISCQFIGLKLLWQLLLSIKYLHLVVIVT